MDSGHCIGAGLCPSIMMAGDNHGGLFQEHRIVGIHIPGGYGADITISDIGNDVVLDKPRVRPCLKNGKTPKTADLFLPLCVKFSCRASARPRKFALIGEKSLAVGHSVNFQTRPSEEKSIA